MEAALGRPIVQPVRGSAVDSVAEGMLFKTLELGALHFAKSGLDRRVRVLGNRSRGWEVLAGRRDLLTDYARYDFVLEFR